MGFLRPYPKASARRKRSRRLLPPKSYRRPLQVGSRRNSKPTSSKLGCLA